MDVKKKRTDTQGMESANGGELKRKTAVFLKSTFFGLLFALCGFFLGGTVLPFGAMPLGVAFLAVSDRKVFYIYAGLVLFGLQTENRVLFIGVYTSVLLIRLLVRFLVDTPWKKGKGEEVGELTLIEIYPQLFYEKLSLRMTAAAVGALGIGIFRLVEGGMLYYDMYGTVISTLAAPLFVLLSSGMFVKSAGRYRRLISFLSIFFAIIYATGGILIYGISVGAAVCTFVTLYIAKKGGTVLGTLSGGLLGLALSVELVPMFAFAALVAGLLFNISVPLAVGSALSVALAWGFYVRGIGILNGLASALVGATLAFTVWNKIFDQVKPSEESEGEREAEHLPLYPERETDRARIADTRARLSSAGESFRSMSEVLMSISQKLRTPSASDLKQICDNAFDASCTSCQYRSVCWGEKYRETTDSLGNICAVLQKKGSVGADEVDESLVERCTRLPDIISEINHNTFLHTREILESDRTEVFAIDYSAVADFMDRAMEQDEGEYKTDEVLGEKIIKELSDEELDIRGAIVFGARRRKIALYGGDRDSLAENRKRIGQMLSEICPFSVNEGELDGNEAILRYSENEAFSVACAQRNLCAEGEEKYCGDTSGMFRTGEGRFYSFISDGMGSGREAALTSGIAALFIRKFLSGDSSCESTLKLLNGFLRNRGGGSLHECSATVDLMELDLISGHAGFYKSGAAPTYIFRNGSLFKLRSHTVPVGIISELDSRKIDFDVSGGDVVVMVSDGVTDGKEECPWLFDLLRSQAESASPDRLADLVVKYAKAEGATDDISVLVIKIV